jgi:hypothetical protein
VLSKEVKRSKDIPEMWTIGRQQVKCHHYD